MTNVKEAELIAKMGAFMDITQTIYHPTLQIGLDDAACKYISNRLAAMVEAGEISNVYYDKITTLMRALQKLVE